MLLLITLKIIEKRRVITVTRLLNLSVSVKVVGTPG